VVRRATPWGLSARPSIPVVGVGILQVIVLIRALCQIGNPGRKMMSGPGNGVVVNDGQSVSHFTFGAYPKRFRCGTETQIRNWRLSRQSDELALPEREFSVPSRCRTGDLTRRQSGAWRPLPEAAESHVFSRRARDALRNGNDPVSYPRINIVFVAVQPSAESEMEFSGKRS
jgi:hypothetical protein